MTVPRSSPRFSRTGTPLGAAVAALLCARSTWIVPAAALAACGYGFTSGRSRLPSGAEHVYVAPFENRTVDADAGALVAAALRQELARRGADAGEGAPARIDGVVTRTAFVASSPNGATYRLLLDVSAQLRVGDRVLAEQQVRREEDYPGTVDSLESEGRRRVAMRRAAEAAAREILERFESP